MSTGAEIAGFMSSRAKSSIQSQKTNKNTLPNYYYFLIIIKKNHYELRRRLLRRRLFLCWGPEPQKCLL
jgi:hypothetical protein